MALTKIQKFSYKYFKNFAEKRVSDKLSHSLESAHMEIRAAVYLSVAFLMLILSIAISYVFFLIFIFLLLTSVELLFILSTISIFFSIIGSFIGSFLME